MVAEAVEYVHVKNPEGVVKALNSAEDTAQTIGAITYKITRGLLEKHQKQGLTFDVDMDLAMGLATETVDILTEVAERVNPNANMGTDKLKHDALLHATALHGEQYTKEHGDTEQTRTEARTQMRDYMQQGATDVAFDYINKRAESEGLNTNDMMRAGNKVLTGGKKPLASAVEQGVQTQQEAAPPPVMGQPQEELGVELDRNEPLSTNPPPAPLTPEMGPELDRNGPLMPQPQEGM